MANAEVLNKMKARHNGCPLFETRSKGSLDELINRQVTIKEYYAIKDYHAVAFEEITDKCYLSGGGLKSLLEEFKDDCIGVKIEILPKTKTDDNHDYRPIKVIG